jgi:signal transduction histidine kinase
VNSNRKCLISDSDTAECWIKQLLSGEPDVPLPEQAAHIAQCIKCDILIDSLGRSTGRRSSDRIISKAMTRLLSVLSNYNTELSGMAFTLHSRIEELTVLKTVADALLKASNLDESLRIFLTGVTAGQAFGFNRAVVFLVNQPRRTLEGQLGFGHLDPDRYNSTWRHMESKQLTFGNMIETILSGEKQPLNELSKAVSKIVIPLKREFGSIVSSVLNGTSMRTTSFDETHSTDRRLLEIFGGKPCAIVPFVSKHTSQGLVIVDNPITARELAESDISTLVTLAFMVAAKIDNLILQSQLELRISELEHVQDLLTENKNYLLETERLVEAGKFATTIAHEIKTPLVTIGGYARRALKLSERGRDVINDLGVIVDEISRLESIAKGVLDYSRKPVLNLERIDLNSIISETVGILIDRLEYSKIEVSLDLSDEPLHVDVDRNRMKQVLFNLIDNAAQAMPDGGTLKIASGSSDKENWIKVRDSGCGMTQQTIDQLFKPFFTTRSTGVGLGLPVSKRIVADHGGVLDAESELGVYSEFTVSLPLIDRKPES